MQTPTLDTRPEITAPAARSSVFRTAAVLGAGTMGAQIAAHLANAGLEVHLLDIAAEQGDRNGIVSRGFTNAKKARPNPFFAEEVAGRVTLGNFDDHFERLADVDWIVEAVVERMDVKRSLMERVEAVARPDAVISTNTSGLPIGLIAEERSLAFRRRFLGTHFFNPPRYLKLLELVPSADTDPEVLARVATFGRVHLGKGIVVARDTPYFIGNRIGVYALMQAIRRFVDGEYTIEEIDALTGPLTGRPRSATFRTADLVGLDVMKDVADNLFEAVPDDESREAFRTPELLKQMVEGGALGQKSGAGFYRKEGRDILSIDRESGEYRPATPLQLGDIESIEGIGSLPERLRALFEERGRAGAFFRSSTVDLLAYSARRIPEIAGNPADVDRAIRWGFGWELGPFELWDAIGFDRVLEAMGEDVELPAWVQEMRAGGANSFYRNEQAEVFLPEEGRYVADVIAEDELKLPAIRRAPERTIWQRDQAGLLDLGDGVALYEFRSKANTLGRGVMQGLVEAIERVESDADLRGLVVGNDGKHFSAGANLVEMSGALAAGRSREIESYLAEFQDAVQRIRYARKPVVVAVHQRALGGGCEVVMACPNPVASAESYIGLVELGVGLIPAGTGSMHLAALAAGRSAGGHPSEIQAWLQKFFEQVAMARVSTSAEEARNMGYLASCCRIVMNEDRRLYVAREEVIRLSNMGYLPPPVRSRVKVLGRPTGAALAVMVEQYREGRFISDYDAYLATQLAHVMTGGDLTAAQEVHEDYLLELEREVFLRLLGEEKTKARIESLLKTGRPLRN